MPAFHVQIIEGEPVECRTPLLRQSFALHSAMASVVVGGAVDPSRFACVWSAALGLCLPASAGAPKPSACRTADDWVEYGDQVERWAFGRSGQGYDIERWQSACELAWEQVSDLLPLPEQVEEAAAPFEAAPGDGSGA